MVRGFSGGMMQRLSIARAMMHDPEVLFLDEPSAGLDPQTRLLLWEIIREYNRLGKTIVLTTHYMDEADALCEPPGDHRSRQDHRAGHARGAESRRFPAAICCGCASTSVPDALLRTVARAARGHRGAGQGRMRRRTCMRTAAVR